jgi:hypothetical protein
LTSRREKHIVGLETGRLARIDLEKEDLKRRRKSIKNVHRRGDYRLPWLTG